MPIKQLTAEQLPAYKILVAECGNFFNSIEWLQLYGEQLKLYGIVNTDQKLIAAFYIYHSSIAGLSYLKNPPYTPHIGLCYKNKASNKANSLAFDKTILTELAGFLTLLNYKLLTLAFPYYIKDMQPFIWKKFKVIPNYTYHINLHLSIEELLQNMSPEKRNGIKKAEKDGVIVQQTTDYAVVEKLVHTTFSRKNKAFDTGFVKKIFFKFSNPENSFAFIAYYQQQPAAAVFCVFDKTTCYYLLGGYNNNNKHQGAGASAVWQAMLFAKEKGLQKFDFEGSMLPEVEKFFRGFGGDLVPYYTINKARLPVEMALKFIKRELF